MELNEIKKALYKQSPKAKLHLIKSGVAYYSALLSDETEVRFDVPFNEMGDVTFYALEEAKHLIRWISE
jgi:hypothetical protein